MAPVAASDWRLTRGAPFSRLLKSSTLSHPRSSKVVLQQSLVPPGSQLSWESTPKSVVWEPDKANPLKLKTSPLGIQMLQVNNATSPWENNSKINSWYQILSFDFELYSLLWFCWKPQIVWNATKMWKRCGNEDKQWLEKVLADIYWFPDYNCWFTITENTKKSIFSVCIKSFWSIQKKYQGRWNLECVRRVSWDSEVIWLEKSLVYMYVLYKLYFIIKFQFGNWDFVEFDFCTSWGFLKTLNVSRKSFASSPKKVG